jgi:hypothetical protein
MGDFETWKKLDAQSKLDALVHALGPLIMRYRTASEVDREAMGPVMAAVDAAYEVAVAG